MEEEQAKNQSCEHENQKYKNDLQEKQNELQSFVDLLDRLEIENRSLETVKQYYESDLTNAQTMLQSRDSENQKYKNDLQEKVKAMEKQYNTFIKRESLVDGFN